MVRQTHPVPRRRASVKSAARVGGAVGPLVSVVVRESVGQHHQQAPRRASACLQDGRAVADGRTEAGVRAGFQAVQPPHDLGVEVVVKPFDGHHAHRRPGPASSRRRAQLGHPGRAAQRSSWRPPRAVVRAPSAPPFRAPPPTPTHRGAASTDRSRRRRRLSRYTASSGTDPASTSTRASTAASMSMSSPCGWRWRRCRPIPSRDSGRRTPMASSIAWVADALIFGSTSRTVHHAAGSSCA